MNDDGVSRGLVLADLNGDGFLDVIKRDLDVGPIRYISRCDDTAWLQVELRQEDANRYAVGARVTAISPDGLEQTRWITRARPACSPAAPRSRTSGSPPTRSPRSGSRGPTVKRARCATSTRRTVTVTRDL